MAKLEWDKTGEKLYETGVSNCALYVMADGEYGKGVAWNGITSISESPSGGEPSPLYADNTKYLNLISNEDYGATIEAYMYPDEFKKCNGESEIAKGVTITQQTRSTFGLAYKSLVGNDTDGTDFGYKLHLVYGCLAAPSEKSHSTVNDSPEAQTMSWTISTTPVPVEGFKPTACITIDSTKCDKAKLAAFEKKLFGDESSEATLPLPAEVAELMAAM